MRAADITITQVQGDFQWDPKSYRWACAELCLHADECVGMPSGSGYHTVAAALQAAMQAAIDCGYSSARISYLSGQPLKQLDCQLAAGPVTIERARAAADTLLGM